MKGKPKAPLALPECKVVGIPMTGNEGSLGGKHRDARAIGRRKILRLAALAQDVEGSRVMRAL